MGDECARSSRKKDGARAIWRGAKHHQIATTRAPVIIAIVLTIPFYPLHHYIAKKTHSACTGVVLDTTKFPTTVILEQAMLEMNMTDLVVSTY